MADPDVRSEMDPLDYLTVVFYRSGFTLAGMSLIVAAFVGPSFMMLPLLTAATLCASSLHIYDKRIRSILQFACWTGLVLAAWQFAWLLSLGAALLVFGGLAYKEYFCFRVPGLQLMPLLVALLWFAYALEWNWVGYGLAVLCGGLLLVLSWHKWRMPLHFDIGDKTKYQI